MSAQEVLEPAGVAVYMRVSGEDQRRRGTIENQRPDLDRYLAAYGHKPYGWYEDDAVSGHWVPSPSGRPGDAYSQTLRRGTSRLCSSGAWIGSAVMPSRF
jgi:hypothetical protein